MFTTGGVGIFVHRYIGPKNADGTPSKVTDIQDVLWMENRDRNYDPDIYQLRAVYNVQDLDFDLSQFGLFLQSDTMFLTFHINDMVDKLGRKLMSGDVLELPNLKEYNALDDTLPVALKRFYVVQEGIRSAEGYSPTWWAHLWRVKCVPMPNSQEYADILNGVVSTTPGATGPTVGDVTSPADLLNDANDAVVAEALANVPKAGYDVAPFWIPPLEPADPALGTRDFDRAPLPPTASPNDKFLGYLIGDGLPPNGKPMGSGVIFPQSANDGDYFLRLDFLPNKLFQFNGTRWVRIENNDRTSAYKDRTGVAPPEEMLTQRDKFVNNSTTFVNDEGREVKSRQGLNNILGPENDV
jgi:hypothetical protein